MTNQLQFRDIQDWTAASISIVDIPYHPLAYFEYYENDDEYIKKYIDPKEVNIMTQEPTNNVVVSGNWLERLLDKVITKSVPDPEPQTESKEILDKLDKISENQNKINERLDALENPEPAATNKEDNNTEPSEPEEPQTVELPLNPDGTLNLEDGVVAKYLPSNFGNGKSQGIDPDLTITQNKDNKSLLERAGRNANGMTW